MSALLLLAALQATGWTPGVATKDPDRVICRREQVTGSRAQFRKVCMTRAQWEGVYAGARNVKSGIETFTGGGPRVTD